MNRFRSCCREHLRTVDFTVLSRPRPHIAPSVRTGDSLAPTTTTSKRPTILVPWLAVGAGLAALTALPDASLGDVAGAEPAVAAIGFRSDQVQAFTTALSETAVLAAPDDASITAGSAAAVIDLDVLAEAQRITIQARHGGVGAPAAVDAIPLWSDRTFAAAPTQREEPTPEQWAQLRHCEATGNYEVTNFSGKYRGAYQFDQPTWESVGGTGDPAAASPEEQDLRAALLYQQRGSSPWPFCGQYLD